MRGIASRVWCFLALAIAPRLDAQRPIDPGVWLIGGSAGFTYQHDDANDVDEFNLRLNPEVGHFVLPGLAVSSSLHFLYGTRERTGRIVELGLGPRIAYYVSGINAKIYPYAALRLQLVRSFFHPSRDAPALPSTDATDLFGTIGAGIAAFVSRNAALTAEIFYSRSHFTFDTDLGTDDNRATNSSSLLGLQFGVRVFVY